MRTTVAVAASALVAAAFVPSYVAASAGETCQGQAATHVGTPGAELVGTAAADVIVTNGASKVFALDGDDLICITGRTFDTSAGFGDDVVDGSGASKATGAGADLGGGSDTYLGSAGFDDVNAGDNDDVRRGQVPGTDVIDTAGGGDLVRVGADGVASDDQVRLGAGRDLVEVRGGVPTTLDGGAGRDSIRMRNGVPADWRVDGESGVFVVNGSAMPPASSFSAYDFTLLRWSSLKFRGGPKAEQLYAQKLSFVVKDGPLSARMGGGNDKIEVRTGHTGPFNGGAGRDTIDVANESNRDLGGLFTADLTRDRYRLGDTKAVGIKGIENLHAGSFDSAVVIGDSRANRLQVSGCDMKVYGGAGDDYLSGFQSKPCVEVGGRGVSAYGQDGNDMLDGSNIADVLVGGPGFDVARARDGRDRCVAERRFDCEL